MVSLHLQLHHVAVHSTDRDLLACSLSKFQSSDENSGGLLLNVWLDISRTRKGTSFDRCSEPLMFRNCTTLFLKYQSLPRSGVKRPEISRFLERCFSMMSKDWWEVGLDRHQIQPLLWPSANCEALGKALLSEPWHLDFTMVPTRKDMGTMKLDSTYSLLFQPTL